jgi:hypothetical protein
MVVKEIKKYFENFIYELARLKKWFTFAAALKEACSLKV